MNYDMHKFNQFYSLKENATVPSNISFTRLIGKTVVFNGYDLEYDRKKHPDAFLIQAKTQKDLVDLENKFSGKRLELPDLRAEEIASAIRCNHSILAKYLKTKPDGTIVVQTVNSPPCQTETKVQIENFENALNLFYHAKIKNYGNLLQLRKALEKFFDKVIPVEIKTNQKVLSIVPYSESTNVSKLNAYEIFFEKSSIKYVDLTKKVYNELHSSFGNSVHLSGDDIILTLFSKDQTDGIEHYLHGMGFNTNILTGYYPENHDYKADEKITPKKQIAIKADESDNKKIIVSFPTEKMFDSDNKHIADILYKSKIYDLDDEDHGEYENSLTFPRSQENHIISVIKKSGLGYEVDIDPSVARVKESIYNEKTRAKRDLEQTRKKIEDAVPDLQSSKIRLDDDQIEGVDFLTNKRSAVLGDETGLGKTYQFLVAAKFLMNKSGLNNCLIVSLSPLVSEDKSGSSQIGNEIKTLFPGDSISYIKASNLRSGTFQTPSTWNIINYEAFQYAKQLNKSEDMQKEAVVQQAKGEAKAQYAKRLSTIDNYFNQFEIVILDELNKVKKEGSGELNDSNLAGLVERFIQNAKYKWGVTATLVSKNVKDTANQLKILGIKDESLLPKDMKNFSNKFFPEQIGFKIYNPSHGLSSENFKLPSESDDLMSGGDKKIHILKYVYNDKERRLEETEFNGKPFINVDSLKAIKKKLGMMPKGQYIPNNILDSIGINSKNPLFIINKKKGILFSGDENEYKNAMDLFKYIGAENFAKHLHDSNFFLRRNKKIQSKLNTKDVEFDIDFDEVCKNISSSGNTDQNTLRHEISRQKTRASADKAIQLLQESSSNLDIPNIDLKDPAHKKIADDKILVFTSFKDTAELIAGYIRQGVRNDRTLRDRGLNDNVAVVYTGEESIDIVNKFKSDPKCRVLITTFQKGSTGIDIPNVAKYCILNDMSYTNEEFEQAVGRIYRSNTINDRDVFLMVAKNAVIDKSTRDLLRRRIDIASRVHQGSTVSQGTDYKELANAKIKELEEVSRRNYAAEIQGINAMIAKCRSYNPNIKIDQPVKVESISFAKFIQIFECIRLS